MTTTTTKQPSAVTAEQIEQWQASIAAVKRGDDSVERPWVSTRQLEALLAERERLIGKSAADDQALSSYEQDNKRLREALLQIASSGYSTTSQRFIRMARAALGGGGK